MVVAKKDCDDECPCTVAICYANNGKCKYSDAKQGSKCEDGEACATKDSCYKGKCKAGDDKG